MLEQSISLMGGGWLPFQQFKGLLEILNIYLQYQGNLIIVVLYFLYRMCYECTNNQISVNKDTFLSLSVATRKLSLQYSCYVFENHNVAIPHLMSHPSRV